MSQIINFPEHFSERDKIEYLQRKIILNCIAYYELDESPLSDGYYGDICKQLIELQNAYGDISDTKYGYVMYDFDISTGFDLYHRLTDEDKDYLMNIAIGTLKKEETIKKQTSFLYDYQLEAMYKMKNGCILNGGVGSGKSRTGLFYYFKEHGGWLDKETGYIPMKKPSDLYIITTAKKRDSLEWEGELVPFLLYTDPEKNKLYGNKVVIDSWNNIKKYVNAKNAFFIFDEDRVTGSGAWVQAFLKIAKNNRWVILSATPGDVWADYIPVFIANGFYKNRTEFYNKHVVFSRFVKYPKIDRYLNIERLIRLRDRILVDMEFDRHTIPHHEDVYVRYSSSMYRDAGKHRWNPYTNKPIKNAGELCYTWRRIVNSDVSRQIALLEIFEKHPKMIIFYNFDYELEILRGLYYGEDVEIAEWNGHKHQEVPTGDRWVYLVNYNAGAEGWNCITTDTIVFFSQNYSYRTLQQAIGRIDRLNTPYTDLYYYHLKSRSGIDLGISRALKEKRNFNENRFVNRGKNKTNKAG